MLRPNVLFIMTDQQRFDTIAALAALLLAGTAVWLSGRRRWER